MDLFLLHFEAVCAICNVFFSQFRSSQVMPRRVVNLYACWWLLGSTRSATMWKMMSLCLLWYLWRERNDRSFEYHERTLEKIKSLFYNILYLWIFVSSLVISYHDCLVLFALIRQVASLVYILCTQERLMLLMIFQLLIKNIYIQILASKSTSSSFPKFFLNLGNQTTFFFFDN